MSRSPTPDARPDLRTPIFDWPQGRRPDDHPSLGDLGL
jgi:nuclear transport factor 2 (NTF2) superfamily protein